MPFLKTKKKKKSDRILQKIVFKLMEVKTTNKITREIPISRITTLFLNSSVIEQLEKLCENRESSLGQSDP